MVVIYIPSHIMAVTTFIFTGKVPVNINHI